MANFSCGVADVPCQGAHRLYLNPLAFCQACVIALGIPANLLTIYVLHWRLRQSAFRVLLTGLALYDLFTCSLTAGMDLGLTVGLEEVRGRRLGCQAMSIFGNTNALATYVLLLAVAVHRYRAICRPHAWQFSLRAAKVTVAMAPLATLPMAGLSCALATERIIPLTNSSYVLDCATKESDTDSATAIAYQVSTGLLNIVLTFCLAALYFAIFRKLRQTGSLVLNVEASRKSSHRVENAVECVRQPDEKDTDDCGEEAREEKQGPVTRTRCLWNLVRSTFRETATSVELSRIDVTSSSSDNWTTSKVDPLHSNTEEAWIAPTIPTDPLLTNSLRPTEQTEEKRNSADGEVDNLYLHSGDKALQNGDAVRQHWTPDVEQNSIAPECVVQTETRESLAETNHCSLLGSQVPTLPGSGPVQVLVSEARCPSTTDCSLNQMTRTKSSSRCGDCENSGVVLRPETNLESSDCTERPPMPNECNIHFKEEDSEEVANFERENSLASIEQKRTATCQEESRSVDANTGRPSVCSRSEGARCNRRMLGHVLAVHKRRVAIMLVVLIVFVVSFLPAVLANILHERLPHLGLDARSGSSVFALMMRTFYLSSLCNPLIYSVGDLQFRRQLKLVFSRCPRLRRALAGAK